MSGEKINTLFGMDFPVIQAPMAGVQDSELCIAVCNAGGLGSLPCAMLGADQVSREIESIRKACSGPFNLNFFCHQMSPYETEQALAWQTVLAPYFNELGLDSGIEPGGPGRTPFNHALADAIEPYRPEIISFHFGLPEESLMQRVKGWGTRVLSSATTVDEALWLESMGVDAIIAQGLEAGGHRGMFLSTDLSTQLGTLSLVRQLAVRVSVPVIAAGGIADRQGVEAAMTLGAAGVQVGTAYLLCTEAKTSDLHRSALASDRARHTAITNVFSGRPARSIVNRAVRELGGMHANAPVFPHAAIEISRLRGAAEARNSDDFTPLWCGQNASGCKNISARELTRMLAGA